jgi:hypothetical protein
MGPLLLGFIMLEERPVPIPRRNRVYFFGSWHHRRVLLRLVTWGRPP